MDKKPSIIDVVPPTALKVIKEKKFLYRSGKIKKEGSGKYSKKRTLTIYQGYDAFENFLVVRTYIKRRYDIPLELLELLLYLAPKNYFTLDDYYYMPKQFKYNSIKYLIKNKHVIIVQKGKDRREHLYKVSTHARNIVILFYKHLSGELPIPETERAHNPMALQNASAFDKMKMNIIKQINQMPVSETKKALFK